MAQRVSGSAIEWAGGVGFTRETGIEKYWRDSKIVSPSYRALLGLILAIFSFRVPFMKVHQISSCKQLRSSYKRSTHNVHAPSFLPCLSMPHNESHV